MFIYLGLRVVILINQPISCRALTFVNDASITQTQNEIENLKPFLRQQSIEYPIKTDNLPNNWTKPTITSVPAPEHTFNPNKLAKGYSPNSH